VPFGTTAMRSFFVAAAVEPDAVLSSAFLQAQGN
jgi:hypothetical protein